MLFTEFLARGIIGQRNFLIVLLAFFDLQDDNGETEESTAESSADAVAAEASKLLFQCHEMTRVADGARKAQAAAMARAASNREWPSQVHNSFWRQMERTCLSSRACRLKYLPTLV